MINWTSVKIQPNRCSSTKEYLVTVKYDGEGNENGRMTMCMTFEKKGRNKIPTWCRKGSASIWEVLFWAELPEACQD